MKVLVVSQYFWPESFRINDVAHALTELGCEVTVLTGQPNYPDGVVYSGYRWWKVGRDDVGCVAVYRVPLIPRGRGVSWRLALNYSSFVVAGCLLAPALLVRRRFDVILVFGMSPILQAIPAVLLKWLRGVPLVTWVQDLWPESLAATGYVKNTWLLRIVGAVVRWIYRRNDLVLAQSHAFVRRIEALAGGTRVVYHPNPGDAPRPPSRECTQRPVTLEPGFNVVFAGNLGTFQGLDTILEAAELLAEDVAVRVVLIGSGSRREWVAQQVSKRQLRNVQLRDRVAAQDVPLILEQASALLVSLTGDPTIALTIPSKLQTYLASGRPIIGALDGEGARIIVEAGAGIVCGAEDPSALASAVRTLARSSLDEREAMGRRGREYYLTNFAPALLSNRLLGYLREVAGPGRRVQGTAVKGNETR